MKCAIVLFLALANVPVINKYSAMNAKMPTENHIIRIMIATRSHYNNLQYLWKPVETIIYIIAWNDKGVHKLSV